MPLNKRDLHKAIQWWGFVYTKQYQLLNKYYDSEHIIDTGYNNHSNILNIWIKEGRPIVQIVKKALK